MKVVILNGNPDPENRQFEAYLGELDGQLTARKHQVEILTLRDMDFRFCIGCFGCWVKTPGQCVTHDDSHATGRLVINSDLVLLASPLVMGFISAVLKKTQDKLIGLVHPYLVLVDGECHHINRYESYPRLAVLVEKEADTDEEDLDILKAVYERTSINFKSSLQFFQTTDSPVGEVADEIDGL